MICPLFSQNNLSVICPVHNIHKVLLVHKHHFWLFLATIFRVPQLGAGRYPLIYTIFWAKFGLYPPFGQNHQSSIWRPPLTIKWFFNTICSVNLFLPYWSKMLTVRHFNPIGREHCCRHRWILTTDPLSVVSRDPYLLNTTSRGAGSHSYVFTTLPKPDLDNQHAAGITPLSFLGTGHQTT